MTVEQFKEIMSCNEPTFSYNGQEYSICWPDGRYYAAVVDSSDDTVEVFESLDDLLENWTIQGKRLKDIIKDIEID